MPYPIGILEWQPSAAGVRKKRVSTIATDGYGTAADNPNYNTIRWDSVASREIAGTLWEVACYWDTDDDLVLAVREDSGSWTFYVYDGVAESPQINRAEVDAHNTVVCAIDTDGYIHVAYDHHDDPLNYRRSDAPLATFDGTLTAELSMLGTNEAEVTYPMFFHDPLGVLYFGFRDGESGNGNFYIYKYTTATETWAALAGTTAGLLINGVGSTGGMSPYWHGRPCFSPDWDGAGTGFMWFAWVWRSGAGADTSSNPSAVRWNGTNWTQADGTSQTIPITDSNADVVHTVAEALKLQSFNASCIDGDGVFHMFETYEDAGDSNQQKIWHSYWNGSAWDGGFITDGNDTPTYQYYSLDAVCDQDTNTLRVIVPHPTATELGVYAYVSDGDDWDTWTKETLTDRSIITPGGAADGSNSSVAHDRYQWENYGVYRTMVALTGSYRPTTETFEAWSGYLTATADAPASQVESAILKVALTSTHAEFWAAVDSAGDDIRATDSEGQRLPVDLAEWNYAGQYALLIVHWFGAISDAITVRIYAGNGSASAPGEDDPFGRHDTYPVTCRGFWPSGGLTDRTTYDNDFTMTGSPSATANTGAMGETTYDYDGSTQYGLATASIPTAAPWTLIANARIDVDTAGQIILCIADASATDQHVNIDMRGDVASDPVRFTVRNSTAENSDKIGFTAATWHHVAGVAPTTAARTVYLDGVAGTEDTGDRQPTGLDRIGIGVLARSALDGKFNGKIANAQLYDVALSGAQLAYDSAQNNQTTFWNGWTWTEQGGGLSIPIVMHYRRMMGVS